MPGASSPRRSSCTGCERYVELSCAQQRSVHPRRRTGVSDVPGAGWVLELPGARAATRAEWLRLTTRRRRAQPRRPGRTEGGGLGWSLAGTSIGHRPDSSMTTDTAGLSDAACVPGPGRGAAAVGLVGRRLAADGGSPARRDEASAHRSTAGGAAPACRCTGRPQAPAPSVPRRPCQSIPGRPYGQRCTTPAAVPARRPGSPVRCSTRRE